MSADPALRSTIGPYRIVARVGAGGMGEVFKAWDPRLERDVAIKLLHPETAADPERQKRLLAEGRAASALNHPNILRVYDADVDGDVATTSSRSGSKASRCATSCRAGRCR